MLIDSQDEEDHGETGTSEDDLVAVDDVNEDGQVYDEDGQADDEDELPQEDDEHAVANEDELEAEEKNDSAEGTGLSTAPVPRQFRIPELSLVSSTFIDSILQWLTDAKPAPYVRCLIESLNSLIDGTYEVGFHGSLFSRADISSKSTGKTLWCDGSLTLRFSTRSPTLPI